MYSIVNVRFKVTRVDQVGNRREPYSRLFVLESVELDQSSGRLTRWNPRHFSRVITDIKKAFPELNEGTTSGTHSIKLLFPGNCIFLLYFLRVWYSSSRSYLLLNLLFFFLDAEGDNILVETTLYPYVRDSEATKDLVAIIEMNKRKC